MQFKNEMQQTTNTCDLQFLLFVYNGYNISDIWQYYILPVY